MTYLPQPPAAIAGAPCMRVGSGGSERCAAAGVGSEWESTGSGMRRSPPSVAGVHPDVRAPVLSLLLTLCVFT